jgi:hypothetical protein
LGDYNPVGVVVRRPWRIGLSHHYSLLDQKGIPRYNPASALALKNLTLSEQSNAGMRIGELLDYRFKT